MRVTDARDAGTQGMNAFTRGIRDASDERSERGCERSAISDASDEKSDSVSLQRMPPRLDSDSDNDNGGNLPDFDDEDHGPMRSTAPCYCRHCAGRNMLSKRQRSRHRQKYGWAANAPQAWTMHFVVHAPWHALPHA